jgi:hypothetical protein
MPMPPRRRRTYSLLTMFAAMTLAAVIVALRGKEILMMPLLGMLMTYLGYGPCSSQRNPTAGLAFVCIGFLLRLVGTLLVLLTILWLLFAYSMTRPPHAT